MERTKERPLSIIDSDTNLLTKRENIQKLNLQKNELRKYLNEINNEEREEIIFDILDFLEGFCQPSLRLY